MLGQNTNTTTVAVAYHPSVFINGIDATIGPWHDHIVIGNVLDAQYDTILASDTDNGSAAPPSAIVNDKVSDSDTRQPQTPSQRTQPGKRALPERKSSSKDHTVYTIAALFIITLSLMKEMKTVVAMQLAKVVELRKVCATVSSMVLERVWLRWREGCLRRHRKNSLRSTRNLFSRPNN